MESTEVIIARLVLGYLKDEGCKSFHKEFLKASNHLHKYRVSNTKYIPTRYLGLTLQDILTEYFKISEIVQGRLESTNYYEEHHPKNSLQHQVIYLMNKVQSNATSTPRPSYCRSPEDMQIESSPQMENLSDVEATPAHSLPGNVQYESEESACNNTPSRNGHKYTSSPQKEMQQEIVDTEELAKTLLENREFQEKIAQNINKAAERRNRVSEELDKTVKSVVKETEKDPIFNQILDDIICTSDLLNGSRKVDNHSTEENVDHKQKRIHNNIVHHPEQNASTAKQEIVETPNSTNSTCDNSTKQQSFPKQNVSDVSKHVIVFNGPLESYLGNSSINSNFPQSLPVHNPVYINASCSSIMTNVPTCSSLLPNVTTYSGLMMPSIPNSSQIVVLNQQTQAGWQPSVPYLSEQEIMAMPTVIVNDSSNSGTQKQKQILPMPSSEASVGLNEYLNFKHKPDRNQPQQGLKKVLYPVSTQKPPAPPVTSTVDQQTNTDQLPDLSEDKLPMKMENKLPDSTAKATEDNNQEPLKTPQHVVEAVRRKTPRSGSHVRNLDFSSPPKIASSHKKSSNRNPKTSQPPKKQAVKSLFGKEEDENGDSKKAAKIWDQDLRASLPYKSPPRVKKQFKRRKKSKLNTTAQDAALLEAALLSPVENRKDALDSAGQEPDKKTVLSPSKLSNSKKNIMNVKDDSEDQLTPTYPADRANHPVKANRNISAMLETPLKLNVPKTPGAQTPNDHNITPFSKMLEANLKGIDISSLPTPSMPITPGFPPFTPNIDVGSPYANRPTDYSTSSSYYLPSDSEQNKSVEAEVKGVEMTVKVHLEHFNKNIIGKKNLNLMKPELALASPGSSSESSSEEEVSNDTVIMNQKDSPKKGYVLRARKQPEPAAPAPDKKEKPFREKNVKASTKKKPTSEDTLNNVENSTKPPENKKETKKPKPAPREKRHSLVATKKTSVLKELEEKRQRMIEAISEAAPSKAQPAKPAKSGKFKIKPVSNLTGVRKKPPRKPVATAKPAGISESSLNMLRDDLYDSDETDDEEEVISLELSLGDKKPEDSASDAEAQKMIDGLKERGILLVHNKSPNKSTKTNTDSGSNCSSRELEGESKRLATEDEPKEQESHEGAPEETTCSVRESESPPKNEAMNCSSSIDTHQRDTFDLRVFETEDSHVVHDESEQLPPEEIPAKYKPVESSIIGKVFLEEIGAEIDVHLKFGKCFDLLDLPSLEVAETEKIIIHDVVVIQGKNEKAIGGVEDDLMDFAATGNDEPKTASPRSVKKRKLSGSGNDSAENAAKYLKGLDVDQFLNNIHAGRNFHVKK